MTQELDSVLQAITANQVATIHFHINFMKLKVNYATKWSGCWKDNSWRELLLQTYFFTGEWNQISYCSVQRICCHNKYFNGGHIIVGVNVSTPTAATTSGIGGPCPPGFYCPLQTEDPIPCPNGTYRDTSQGAKKDDCLPCKLGEYCGSEGLTNGTGPCAKGFYCYRGNNVPTPLGEWGISLGVEISHHAWGFFFCSMFFWQALVYKGAL